MTWLLNVIARWRCKPRTRILTSGGLGYRLAAVYLVVVFGLLYGGFSALFGFDPQGNRWLGFAALVGGCVLLTVGFLHLMRPVKRRDDVQSETAQDH
jgi:hypothetical protein